MRARSAPQRDYHERAQHVGKRNIGFHTLREAVGLGNHDTDNDGTQRKHTPRKRKSRRNVVEQVLLVPALQFRI